jgi:serine/threonine protein kinase
MSEVLHEPEPETWQTDALGLLEADPVRPPSEGLARRTRDVARALARSAEPAGTLPVGARVGPYTLGEVLGRGGQATVYRATDDEGRAFAVKVPRPELVSRLAREAQILFHLDHPRIVRIERADMRADPPFIACRLLEGGTLAERLRKGPMSPPDVACLADQILEALIHGHEKGVVHRDLKPSNVLFDRQHDAQVADFGVGSLRLVEEHGLGQTLVSVDVTRGAGTPLYMAPEQEQAALRVDGKVDGRADLYALGKLLYEALTGRPPRTIRPVSQLVIGIDRRWDAFLFRLVEDRPQDRFPDAAVAREALRLLLRPAPAREGVVGTQELLRLAEERRRLDEKAAATEQAYRNLESKLGEVNLQFRAREAALRLEREALDREKGEAPSSPGVEFEPIRVEPPSTVERREALRGALERNLREPGKAPSLETVERALHTIQVAARASSVTLLDDDGRVVSRVGLIVGGEPGVFAAMVAASCAAMVPVARVSDVPEFDLHVHESRSTVLTVARVAPGLRVAILGGGVPPRGPLRQALVGLAQTLLPDELEPLRGLSLVRRAPEEPSAIRASFVTRASSPFIVTGALCLMAGLTISGGKLSAIPLVAGLGLGLILGIMSSAALWGVRNGRIPR